MGREGGLGAWPGVGGQRTCKEGGTGHGRAPCMSGGGVACGLGIGRGRGGVAGYTRGALFVWSMEWLRGTEGSVLRSTFGRARVR